MADTSSDDAMNTDEARAFLGGMTRKRLYGLVASGDVPALRLGGRRLLFSRSRLGELLREGNTGPEAESADAAR